MTTLINGIDSIAEFLTPFTFNSLHSYIQVLSDAVGFAPDQLRYCLSLFAAYPFAILFRFLPSHGKHWFSFLIGLLMAQFVLGNQWIHSFITSTITYLIVLVMPSTYAPQLVFAFNMLYMSASHLYRIYVDYLGWSLDFTGPQMLLVIKLTSFAYNVYDGQDAKLSSEPSNPQQAKVYANRRKLAISSMPNIIEFYGFAYCFTTFLAGPAFEYREYLDAVTLKKFNHPKGVKWGMSCLRSALSKLAIGLISMAAMAIFGSKFSLSTTIHATDYASFLHRWGSIYIALLIIRCKYYFAWKVAEGSTVLSGFGFEGYTDDGEIRGWNAVSNVDILGFELGQSIRDLSRAWNKGTQAWLQRYVYERMHNSLLATYFVSAFWHGFYPGYYLFFLSVPLPTAVNRVARSVLRPYFVDTQFKIVYDLLGMLATCLTINYLAVSFVSLSWEESIFGWSSLYYLGHIGLVVVYLLLLAVPRQKVAKAA